MATQNSVVYKNFVETDFEKIKESFKTHLRSQDQFKDFDFEASAINVLLNVLAYNTQYNAYYANMNASEKFVRTAQKRESLSNLSTNFGYLPISAQAAKAFLSFQILPDTGYTGAIFFPKDTKFSTSVDGISYSFLNRYPVSVLPDTNGNYFVTGLELFEGKKFTHRYTISNSTILEIPNSGVDIGKITVYVKESANATTKEKFELVEDYVQLTSATNAYFLQEVSAGKYDIYFGDGVIGRKLNTGNVVEIEYYTTSGSAVNGTTEFSLDDEVTGLDSIIFGESTSAGGGFDGEQSESLRTSIPSSFRAQNRAATEEDYVSVVKKIYPAAVDIIVWGGEKETPKQYGRVFLCIVEENNKKLTATTKNLIVNQLGKSFSFLTVEHIIKDPIFINVEANVDVIYDPLSTKSPSEIKTIVSNGVIDFADTIGTFGFKVYKSQFENYVNELDEFIISNTTTFRLYAELNTAENTLFVDFKQPLEPKKIVSTNFIYDSQTVYLNDVEGNGNIALIRKNNNGTTDVLQSAVAKANYTTGVVTLLSTDSNIYKFFFEPVVNFRIYASTVSENVIADKTNILVLESKDLTISVTAE